MARTSSNRGGTKEKFKSITMIVGPFRMAFPAVFEPEEDDNGNEKYKVTMLFPPDSKSIKAIDDALYEAMEDRFGPEADWPSGKKDILPEDKFYDAGRKTYQGFKKGWMVLTASSNDAPGVIDADKNEVLSKREVYGGRWARAEITVASFDNKAKGVTAYLNHLQLLEHDDAFSGKGNAEDKFDKYELSEKRGRRRDEDDEDDDRGSRRRSRDDDRGSKSRSESRHGRDDEDDADDGRGRSKGRGRDDEDDDRSRGRGRGRDDDDRGRSRSRSRDDDDEDERGSRGRSRGRDDDDEDDRRSSRGRDKGRSRDDDDDDRDRGRGKARSRSRDDDDDWN